MNNHLEKISAAAQVLSDFLSPENDVHRHEIKYEVRRALDIASAGQFMLEFSDLQSRLKQLAEVTTARSIEKGRGAGSRPRNKVDAVRLLLRDLAFVWIDATGNLPSITSDHAGNKFQHFVQGLAPSFDIETSRLMTPTTVRKVVKDLRQFDLSDANLVDK